MDHERLVQGPSAWDLISSKYPQSLASVIRTAEVL